jgi:hypothetical protein
LSPRLLAMPTLIERNSLNRAKRSCSSAANVHACLFTRPHSSFS